MQVYFDESGDLGWTFDNPYRMGGSSRFLTIAHVFVAPGHVKYVGRLVRALYRDKGRPRQLELKACHLEDRDRMRIASETIKLVRAGRVEVHAITVLKENVAEHIRKDQNLICNYMVKECILKELSRFQEVTIIPDSRSIKMRLANALDMYLKLQLVDVNAQTQVVYTPVDSASNLQVQCSDYIANIIWRRHEFKDEPAYQILHPYIRHKVLFPRKAKRKSKNLQ